MVLDTCYPVRILTLEQPMNRQLLSTLSLALAIMAPVASQDFLRYKFDANCGSEVINYAFQPLHAGTGTLVSNLPGLPAGAWTDGRFGDALRGGSVVAPTTHNYVDTGWAPGVVTGSMTWACWMRMDPTVPTPSLTYLFGNGTTFRVFTGGGGFLLTAAWGGTNVNTVTNVQTLARAGWTHVACVLDGAALQGQYYINGVPESPVNMTAAVNWTGNAFFVGKYSALTNASIFDLDEFVLVNRALTATEVTALVNGPFAADGRYGASCGVAGPSLDNNGTLPALGNFGYGFQVNGPATGFAWLLFGFSRCSIAGGALPLPIDLGTFTPLLSGCAGLTDTDYGSLSGVLSGGTANIGFPLPPFPALSGLHFFTQAVTLDGATGALRSSNAMAVGIGL